MALGYRGNDLWRDMSEYVVHFTKDDGKTDPYKTIMSILFGRVLIPGDRFGIASKLSAAPAQEAVCFSEIPLDHLGRIADRRKTKYGIGFRQDVLVAAGGARVWYVDQGTALETTIRNLMVRTSTQGGYAPLTDPIWNVTPFIDVPGVYPGSGGALKPYRFEWEREWRVRGEFRFEVKDVAFLFIPEGLHRAARGFFQDAAEDNSGPAYGCPFIDPSWDDERIQREVATHVPPTFRRG